MEISKCCYAKLLVFGFLGCGGLFRNMTIAEARAKSEGGILKSTLERNSKAALFL
jgi:hypothetical protein